MDGDTAEACAKYRRRATRIPGIWLPPLLVDPLRRCPHLNQRGIYGDEIIAARWRRARCLDCGRLLSSLPPAPSLFSREHADNETGE